MAKALPRQQQERGLKMQSYEALIGKAMLGDQEDKDDAIRRLGIKLQVTSEMFCKCCQKVLDQTTAIVTEFRSGEDPWGVVAVTCNGDCSELAREIVKTNYIENDEVQPCEARGLSWDRVEWHDKGR